MRWLNHFNSGHGCRRKRKTKASQFHFPGGATVGASSSENVNRVKFAQIKREGRYPRQVNRFGKQSQQASGQQCWRCGGKHALQACKVKFDRCFDVATQYILRSQRSAKANQGCVLWPRSHPTNKMTTSWCTARTQCMHWKAVAL